MLNQTMGMNPNPEPRRRRRRRKPEQLELDHRVTRRGGRRKGAGRKAAAGRKDVVKHVARPRHEEETPVHVVTRAARGVPYLRSQRLFAAMRVIIARASEKGFRV